MRLSHLTGAGVAAAMLVACGASERGEAKPEGPPAAIVSGGAEPATAEPATAEPAMTEPATAEPAAIEPAAIEPATIEPEPATAEPATIEQDGARLSVYVRGPAPVLEMPASSGAFEAEIVVINTGDGPADVAEARASFDAWRGDRRIECGSAELEGPATLGPGEAHVYRATATCDLASGEEHEVRAYLEFGADSGELHREVHHVGTRDVMVE